MNWLFSLGIQLHRIKEERGGAIRMTKKFATFDRIEPNKPITQECHYEFLYQLQRALLLALKEQKRLSLMQYRYAEDKLQQQRRSRAHQKQEELWSK
jgi:hypothetical protein